MKNQKKKHIFETAKYISLCFIWSDFFASLKGAERRMLLFSLISSFQLSFLRTVFHVAFLLSFYPYPFCFPRKRVAIFFIDTKRVPNKFLCLQDFKHIHRWHLYLTANCTSASFWH